MRSIIKMFKLQKKLSGNLKQQGQTLIETLVAIFILTMGITSATSLAIYAYSASSGITKQIIASGLAREGIEAIKNSRDTNWLKLTLDTNCYNYASSPAGLLNANCYKQWLDKGVSWDSSGNAQGFRIDPSLCASGFYTVQTDSDSANKTWVINCQNSATFGLNLNTTVDSSFGGFYVPSGSSDGNSDYYRKITLIKNTSSPYMATLERLEVVSQVWWTDKNCPRSADFPTNGKCFVEMRTYLTNWKDYAN